MERLRKLQPRIDMTAFVKPAILDAIYDEMKLPRITDSQRAGDGEDDQQGGQGDAPAVDFSIAMRRQMHARALDAFDD